MTVTKKVFLSYCLIDTVLPPPHRWHVFWTVSFDEKNKKLTLYGGLSLIKKNPTVRRPVRNVPFSSVLPNGRFFRPVFREPVSIPWFPRDNPAVACVYNSRVHSFVSTRVLGTKADGFNPGVDLLYNFFRYADDRTEPKACTDRRSSVDRRCACILFFTNFRLVAFCRKPRKILPFPPSRRTVRRVQTTVTNSRLAEFWRSSLCREKHCPFLLPSSSCPNYRVCHRPTCSIRTHRPQWRIIVTRNTDL